MATIHLSHLEQRTNRSGEPRVYIAGTRIRVQDIAVSHEFHAMSPEQIVREFPHLTLGQVHAALAYFFDHRAEIQAELDADAAYAESMREHFQKTSLIASRRN